MNRRALVLGNLITMDPSQPRAQAMAMVDGRIAAVGSVAEARAAVGAGAIEYRYADGSVLPGLIDSHNHMLATGLQSKLVDLSGSRSIGEVVGAVRAYAQRHPERAWIVSGQGWHVDNLQERRYPTRQELDDACPERPVYLPRVYHAAAVNSKALQLAGISAATPDPAGGTIERDERGQPNGVLHEAPAMRLVERLLPPLSRAERLKALRDVQRAYLAAGICGVIEPGLTAEEMSLYQELWRSGELRIRTVLMPLAQTADDADMLLDRLAAWGVRTGFGDDRLKLGGIKVFLDGGASLGTALLREPYPGERCNCGIQVTHSATFHRLVEFCACSGWSLGVHAVGGKAIDIALDTFAEVDARHSIRDLRFSIIHAYLWPSPENIALASKLGVAVATQASMQYQFAPLLVRRFGAEAIARATPIRSWIDGGVLVAGGSDAPATPFQPFVGIWHAVTRYVDALQGSLGMAEAISAEQALKLYTRNAAWLSFSEQERGMLRPGFVADWVAVSVDPLRCAPEALRAACVLATGVGGELVHQG